MGCVPTTPRVHAEVSSPMPWHQAAGKGETLVAALARLDEEIAHSERTYPAARLAVVSAELASIQQEIKTFEDVASTMTNKDTYAKTLHQVFVSLDLYRRPVLATENEDFVANVNRKEMRRLELGWLQTRQTELQRERRTLHAQILRTRSLYAQLQRLLDSVWANTLRPGTPIEDALSRALGLRDALAAVSARLRAAAEHAHAAARLLDDALPAWKLAGVGKSGWERTSATADACLLLVQARCLERGARRVLSAPAAPRAARTLRLALDYAFTDTMHDYKYQRATEIFVQFKEALVQLINSIHQTSRKLLKRHIILALQRRHKTKTKEIPIFINGKAVSVPSYFTIMQACRSQGIAMPSFCYHERLSVAGNCRMCICTVEGMWKPQIACAVNIWKDMKIRTNDDITLKAQESVLEFILADHPLDCPICDQGGECDLQDLSMKFGNDRTRFTEIHFAGKRAVESKNLGPLIATSMNRCIHCTRCIRFASQVCGLDVLGTTGRSHDMLVGTYVDKMFLSELSGNIIDLCPVGALTSIPYEFKARSWELNSINSIDVTDATGTNIVLNTRYNRVLRALPREHDEINQEWLSDKGRWAIDSTEMQRLVTPMISSCSVKKPCEWPEALCYAAKMICKVKPEQIAAIAGPHSNAETLVVAKDFLNLLNCENYYIERNMDYTASGIDLRASYGMNINMKNVKLADKILLIGTNPRFEAPILNASIRQAFKTNECDIFVIGPRCDYNYHVEYVGSTVTDLKSGIVTSMRDAKNPLIFVGISQLGSKAASKIMSEVFRFAKPTKNGDWQIVNVVTREASFAGALEAGWKPNAVDALTKCPPKLVISLGADEIFHKWQRPVDCEIIYVGFQGDIGAQEAKVVLPGCAYTEAGGLYLNMECRSQYAYPAVSPPGKARVDWKIFRALAEVCGKCMCYSDQASLHARMAQVSPNFSILGSFQQKLFSDLVAATVSPPSSTEADNIDVEMKLLPDYYCSDVFTCNSLTMIAAKKAAMKFTTLPYHKL